MGQLKLQILDYPGKLERSLHLLNMSLQGGIELPKFC
jgi:hypothetical protein